MPAKYKYCMLSGLAGVAGDASYLNGAGVRERDGTWVGERDEVGV